MSDLSGRTTIVVGASRGLGRAIVTAFAEVGANVIAVSRTEAAFREPANGRVSIRPELADAGDPTVPARLFGQYGPDVVVLVAGARPHLVPLQEQTWETFSVNWQSDVRIAFHWLRAILLKPLRPGSRVIVFSSGAAVGGSPLSGGYAGAKATQRFITAYAQDEAKRAGLNHGSHRRRASADPQCRPMRHAPASPWSNTLSRSPSRRARWSRQKSPPPPWCSWPGKMLRKSRPLTC
jgi:NAD(P)-dependent dehydrogenase (short-subunit alcohol dehydrogenase family)